MENTTGHHLAQWPGWDVFWWAKLTYAGDKVLCIWEEGFSKKVRRSQGWSTEGNQMSGDSPAQITSILKFKPSKADRGKPISLIL